MNGDLVTIENIEKDVIKKANLTFRKVEVKELYTEKVYSQLLIEEIIFGALPNLDISQQNLLFIDFARRMKRRGLKQKDEEFKTCMRKDPYLNALRCVFGYALTCHKSQGGEWNHVFLDFPRDITLNPTRSSYQWIYTAMTRAKVQLHIVDGFYIEGFNGYK